MCVDLEHLSPHHGAKIALEVKIGAVEHVGTEGASPSRGDGKGNMTTKTSAQECHRKNCICTNTCYNH
jgi:hypothetical protein